MNGINVTVISGNLSRDPELRATPTGTSVCSLAVAVNESYKDQSGQWKEKLAGFFDVVVWGASGENAARYLTKGSPVTVEGRLSQRTWLIAQGQNRSKVEIIAKTVIFGSKPDGQGRGENEGHKHDDSGYPQDPDGSEDFGDLPF